MTPESKRKALEAGGCLLIAGFLITFTPVDGFGPFVLSTAILGFTLYAAYIYVRGTLFNEDLGERYANRERLFAISCLTTWFGAIILYKEMENLTSEDETIWAIALLGVLVAIGCGSYFLLRRAIIAGHVASQEKKGGRGIYADSPPVLKGRSSEDEDGR